MIHTGSTPAPLPEDAINSSPEGVISAPNRVLNIVTRRLFSGGGGVSRRPKRLVAVDQSQCRPPTLPGRLRQVCQRSAAALIAPESTIISDEARRSVRARRDDATLHRLKDGAGGQSKGRWLVIGR